MATFKYTGISLSGNPVQGITRAKNAIDLEFRLSEGGIILESCHLVPNSLMAWIHSRYRKAEITRFTRQLEVLVSSGIPIVESIDTAAGLLEDKRLIRILADIKAALITGKTVKESFGRYPAYFDEMYLSLLETGEASGTLGTSLNRIASYREKSEAINKKLKAALTYPVMVLLVAVLVLFILIAYIIPLFSSMYSGFGAELPLLTRKVIAVSEFIKSYAYLIIAFMLILFIGAIWLAQTELARLIFDRLLIKTPGVKRITVKLITARFCRTLGTLLNSGLILIRAIEVSSKTTGNLFVAQKMADILPRLEQGQSLASALKETDLLPTTVLKMTTAGESTGRLGEMFSRLADFYEAQVDIEINALSSVFEPIIIVILGIFIAFILVAMYLPLFELVGQMGI